MKAAVYYGPNNIRIDHIDLEKNSKDNLLLKVLSCSVCSYDVRTFRNGNFKVKPPVILGHEICAQIIDGFDDKKVRIKPNQRVAIYPVVPCLKCWYCLNKNYNLCSDLKEMGSTLNGGFAQFISVPRKIIEMGGLIPVPNNITDEEASLIEPLACCINGLNQIKFQNFDSIIILGDGPIALMQLMLLKIHFPRIDITVVGKVDHRLEMAKEIGCELIINISNDNSDFVSSLKRTPREIQSPNLILISNNDPSSVNLAFELVNKMGTIMIFSGIKHTSGSNIQTNAIDPNDIHYKHISLLGSFSSTPATMDEAVKLLKARKIRLSGLITSTYPISDIQDAFLAAESYTGFKSVINKFEY